MRPRWLPFLFNSAMLMIAFAWAGTAVADPASRPVEAFGGWRRTVNGWELAAQWSAPLTASEPALHPAVVASFEVLAALLALLAIPERPTQREAAGARFIATGDATMGCRNGSRARKQRSGVKSS